MADIAGVLKAEIVRLAKKAVRAETTSLRDGSAFMRKELIALRKRTADLERELKVLRKARAGGDKVEVSPTAAPGRRISGRALKSLRARFGLTQDDMATLLGVSQQSIYNWERHGVPAGSAHLAAINDVRRMKKDAVALKLSERVLPPQPSSPRKTALASRRRKAQTS